MNEMLFIGGLAAAVCSLIAGAIYFIVYKLRSLRLNGVLDEEYGRVSDKTGRGE